MASRLHLRDEPFAGAARRSDAARGNTGLAHGNVAEAGLRDAGSQGARSVRTAARKATAASGGQLPARQYRLAITFLVLVFLSLAAIRWTNLPSIGTDCDEHLIVARTFLRTGHFSVADVHATKYPPLLSSIAILFQLLGLNVPLAIVALNYLLILASSLLLYRFLVGAEAQLPLPASDGGPGCGSFAPAKSKIGLLSLLPVVYLMTNTVLWDSASEILADTLLFFLATVALLLALRVERWTLRMTLLASLVAFLAAMSRSIGLVVVVPLAASIIWDRRQKGERFPYGRLALLSFPAAGALLLFMGYESRFGPHPTGYIETFLLNDPFDASKGTLTLSSFLARTLRGCFDSLRDVRDLTVYASSAGAFSYGLPLVLLIFAVGRDKRRILLICSFVAAYMAVACLWPYKGARFVLPLLGIAALGINGALAWAGAKLPQPDPPALARSGSSPARGGQASAGLQSRNRLAGSIVLLLLVLHIAISTVNLHREAVEKKAARAFLLAGFGAMTDWCREHIPESDTIASFDYRELILRLDRPVVPLGYSSDTRMQIAKLECEHVKWLVVCLYIYPLRATYAKGIVEALGDRATQQYSNDSCEVYRLDLSAAATRSQFQGELSDSLSGPRHP